MMNLDEHELHLLVLALRLWRAQRRSGTLRRTDRPIPPETVEVLLAKLEAARLSSTPPRSTGDPLDPLGELFSH